MMRWRGFSPALLKPLRARKTGFDPRQIAGLQLWLKADSLNVSDGSGVAFWPDSTGQSKNAIQPNPANQPIFTTGVLNGRPAVHFDGTSSWMATASPVETRSIFVVLRHTDGPVFTNYRRVLDGGDVAGWSIFGDVSTPPFTHYTPTSSYTRDITGTNMRVNGVVTNEAAPLAQFKIISAQTTSQWTSTVWIGTYVGTGNQLLMGDIAEVLIYGNPLSDDDRMSIEAHLSKRYNLS